MLTRRLQVLIDDERYERLEAEAARRGVSVATLVREALDDRFPSTDHERRRAADAILNAEPMAVSEPEALKAELAEAHDR